MSSKSRKGSNRGSLRERILRSDLSQAIKEKKLAAIEQPLYATSHSPNGLPHHFKGPEKQEMTTAQRRVRNQAKRARQRATA